MKVNNGVKTVNIKIAGRFSKNMLSGIFVYDRAKKLNLSMNIDEAT